MSQAINRREEDPGRGDNSRKRERAGHIQVTEDSSAGLKHSFRNRGPRWSWRAKQEP